MRKKLKMWVEYKNENWTKFGSQIWDSGFGVRFEKCVRAPYFTLLLTKTDFDNKLINLNKKINSNKTKHLIVENELEKLETFNQSIFVVKVVLKMMVFKII